MFNSTKALAALAGATLACLLVCNSTQPTSGQQMSDLAEELGLIGSMRYQTNLVPVQQRGPQSRDQIIAGEAERPAMQPLKVRRETRMRRQANPQKALSGQASGEVGASPFAAIGEQLSKQGEQLSKQGAALGEQLRSQGAAAVQQLQSFGSQLVANAQQAAQQNGPKRAKRQISYPTLPAGGQGGPEQGANQAVAAVEKSGQSAGSGIMKYLSELGQQAQQAQAIQQLISAAQGASGTPTQQQPKGPLETISQAVSSSTSGGTTSGSSGGGSGALSGVAQMMSQLTDLIKSTQERNARILENGQRNLESTNQQTMEAAKSAQGGIQSALSEMGQGLQRLASNNPNLLPDIKNLYQSVASKLSSASSSVAQTGSNGGPAAAGGGGGEQPAALAVPLS